MSTASVAMSEEGRICPMPKPELAHNDYMALVRTVLAVDRSLMAWVRTALSLIGFGFTIFTFLHSLIGKGSVDLQPGAPRNAGLILIGLGTVSLLLGILEYWKAMRHFHKTYGMSPWRVSMVTSLIVALLGTTLFFLILIGSNVV